MRISNDQKDAKAIESKKRHKTWLTDNDKVKANKATKHHIIDIPHKLAINQSKAAETSDKDYGFRRKCGLWKSILLIGLAVVGAAAYFMMDDIIGSISYYHSSQRQILADAPAPAAPAPAAAVPVVDDGDCAVPADVADDGFVSADQFSSCEYHAFDGDAQWQVIGDKIKNVMQENIIKFLHSDNVGWILCVRIKNNQGIHYRYMKLSKQEMKKKFEDDTDWYTHLEKIWEDEKEELKKQFVFCKKWNNLVWDSTEVKQTLEEVNEIGEAENEYFNEGQEQGYMEDDFKDEYYFWEIHAKRHSGTIITMARFWATKEKMISNWFVHDKDKGMLRLLTFQKKINLLKANKNDIKHQVENDKLHAQLMAEKIKFEDIEKQLKNETEKLGIVEKEKAALQKKLDGEHVQKLAEQKAQHEAAVEELEEAHKAELESIGKLDESAKRTLKDLKDAHKKAIDQKQAQHDQNLEKAQQGHQAALNEVKKGHRAQLEKMTKQKEDLEERQKDEADKVARLRDEKEKLELKIGKGALDEQALIKAKSDLQSTQMRLDAAERKQKQDKNKHRALEEEIDKLSKDARQNGTECIKINNWIYFIVVFVFIFSI